MTPTFPPLTVALTAIQASDALSRTLQAIVPGEVFTADQFTVLLNRYLEQTHPGCNPLGYGRTYPWLQKLVDAKVLQPRKYPVNGTVHTAWSRKEGAAYEPLGLPAPQPAAEIDVEDLDQAVEIRNQTILDLNQKIAGMLQVMGLSMTPEVLMNPVEATKKAWSGRGEDVTPVHAAHEDLNAIRVTLGVPAGSREDLLKEVTSMKYQLDVFKHNEAAGNETEERGDCAEEAPCPENSGLVEIRKLLGLKMDSEIIPEINRLLSVQEEGALCDATWDKICQICGTTPDLMSPVEAVQGLADTIVKDHEVFTQIREILGFEADVPLTEACQKLKAAIDTNDAVFLELIDLLGTTNILEGVKTLKKQPGQATAESIVESLCVAAGIPDQGSHTARYLELQRRLCAGHVVNLPLTHVYKTQEGTVTGCLYGEMCPALSEGTPDNAAWIRLDTNLPLQAALYKLYCRLVATDGKVPATAHTESMVSFIDEKGNGFKGFDFETTGFDYIVYHAPVKTEQDPSGPMEPIILKTEELLLVVAWNNNSLPSGMAPVDTHFTPAIINAPDMVSIMEDAPK